MSVKLLKKAMSGDTEAQKAYDVATLPADLDQAASMILVAGQNPGVIMWPWNFGPGGLPTTSGRWKRRLQHLVALAESLDAGIVGVSIDRFCEDRGLSRHSFRSILRDLAGHSIYALRIAVTSTSAMTTIEHVASGRRAVFLASKKAKKTQVAGKEFTPTKPKGVTIFRDRTGRPARKVEVFSGGEARLWIAGKKDAWEPVPVTDEAGQAWLTKHGF